MTQLSAERKPGRGAVLRSILTAVSSGTAAKTPEAEVLQVFVAGCSTSYPSTSVVQGQQQPRQWGGEYMQIARAVCVYGGSPSAALSSTAMGDPAISVAPVGDIIYHLSREPLLMTRPAELNAPREPSGFKMVLNDSGSSDAAAQPAVEKYSPPRTKLAALILKYRKAAMKAGQLFRSVDEILAELEHSRNRFQE